MPFRWVFGPFFCRSFGHRDFWIRYPYGFRLQWVSPFCESINWSKNYVFAHSSHVTNSTEKNRPTDYVPLCQRRPDGHAFKRNIWKTLNQIRIGVSPVKVDKVRWPQTDPWDALYVTLATVTICCSDFVCNLDDLWLNRVKAVNVARYWARLWIKTPKCKNFDRFWSNTKWNQQQICNARCIASTISSKNICYHIKNLFRHLLLC